MSERRLDEYAMVTINLELPEPVALQAREAGLLSSEQITVLIEAELARRQQEAAARLRETMNALSAAMRADFGDLTDEEAEAMLDEWTNEA